jgi:hypothetical protein
MSQRMFGLRAFGLCLLVVISVMALGASGAQAKGHWFVNLELLTKTVEVEALKSIDVSLVSTFGAGNTPIKILCGAVLIHDGLLFSGGGGLGEILLSSCATYLKNEAEPTKNCKPLEPMVVKVQTLLVSHNGDTYISFSPHDGTLKFTTLHLGELCAAGENIEKSGHIMAECGRLDAGVWTHEDCEAETLEHEIRQVPNSATLFLDKEKKSTHLLKYGGRIASLEGEVKLALKGAHIVHKWGGLAN